MGWRRGRMGSGGDTRARPFLYTVCRGSESGSLERRGTSKGSSNQNPIRGVCGSFLTLEEPG